MTTKEHPDGKVVEQSLPQGATSPAQSVDESRRRFGKSGLAAGGVIITLASRPVLGAWACQSPSGFQSGNVSSHGQPTTCMGRTPGYWGNKPEEWPLPYKAGTCVGDANYCNHPENWTTTNATLFRNKFNCSGGGSIYYNYTMFKVIWLGGGGDPDQLGAHIVSALLNAKMGWTSPVLTEQAVKDMFNDWASKGYYEPSAGIKWYGADIVTYLKTTMTL
ncbi:hypothetical protein SCD_n02346 [Sulfuricella denitrificans skB26]|uniref:Uncharacterized protein n=1 Tax=Sulfuricella denitrificans (strain DSM 22764 / NBRC 105220 / skB26) TaxID=1163617 RepID=S6AMV9_SULDS|nr:hypothetical protein [Sulfuricella denitrificans]BAN36154.1 hypothetical protein SCD_n02346 [Sulfuricella denitrificans skB26]